MYERGEGVSQDFKEAFKCYKKSTEQGYPIAQVSLGERDSMGKGISQDFVQALYWLNLAISRMTGAPLQGASIIRDSRDSIVKFLTPEQLIDVHKQVRKWKPSSHD